MRSTFLLIAALLLPAGAWAADPQPDEMVNNPPYSNWSAFKPGTTVKQMETVKLPDGTKIEISKTSKLIKKNKDQVVVETTVKDSGGGVSESQTTVATYAAKVKMSAIDTPDAVATVTEGKEDVDFKGKKIEAEWVEATTKAGDEVTTEKIWTARDVPGGIVKETLTKKKGDAVVSESVTELVEFK